MLQNFHHTLAIIIFSKKSKVIHLINILIYFYFKIIYYFIIERKIPDEEYRQVIPDLDDYTKEPPGLPPHLRHIILNKSSPTMDPLALPNPQTVSLNLLYCTAIKDGMMVLGGTHRYREKYFTVVFYSIMPISTLH